MRVTVVSGFCLGGGRDVYAGEVLDLPPHVARVKIQQGFVEPCPPEEIASAEPPPATAQEEQPLEVAEPPELDEADEQELLEELDEEESLEEPEHPEQGDLENVTDRDPDLLDRDPRPRGRRRGKT